MKKKYFLGNLTVNFLAIIATLFLLNACQSVDVRGQYVSDEVIQEINQGGLTKKEIVNKIGNPTYIPEYTQNVWYYIQRSQTRRAWFDPKVVEQRIIKVMFNNSDKAISAELVENMHQDNVTSAGDYTKTGGTQKSGVQKFVKNIGRFNKSGKQKARK